MKFHVRYSGNRMGEVVLSKCEILNPRIWWQQQNGDDKVTIFETIFRNDPERYRNSKKGVCLEPVV